MASASTATDTGVPKPSSSPVPVDASPALQVIFPDNTVASSRISQVLAFICFFSCFPRFCIFEEHLPLILVVFSKAAEQNSQEQSTWVLGLVKVLDIAEDAQKVHIHMEWL
jgi:hypothetical protein